LRQQLYIAIAVAIYAIFWAIEPQTSNAIITLVYTLCLCNLTVSMRNGLSFLYDERKSVAYWSIYLALLFCADASYGCDYIRYRYWLDTAPVNYWTYLETGWKFPVVATLIFAVVSQIYHRTKHRWSGATVNCRRRCGSKLRNENCRCRNSNVLAKFNNHFSLNRFLKSRVSKSPEPGNRRGWSEVTSSM